MIVKCVAKEQSRAVLLLERRHAHKLLLISAVAAVLFLIFDLNHMVYWQKTAAAETNHGDVANRNRIVRIGVLANRGKKICLEEWAPTARYLSLKLAPLSFKIVPLGFDQVKAAVANKKVEFLLVNPSMYVALEYRGLVSRIATFLEPSIKGESPQPMFGGVIFWRADRKDIKGLSDIVGKRFAAVAPDSLGGWLAAWREFNRLKIRPEKDFAGLVFCGTHDTVVEAVRTGQADAGTVRSTQMERMALEGRIDLSEFRVLKSPPGVSADYPFLVSTRLYPEWPFAAVRGTDLELGKSVASALLRMDADDPAAKASHGAGWAIPQDYTSVHACLRELLVTPYENFGKVSVRQAVAQYRWVILAVAAVSVTILILALSSFKTSIRLRESEQRLSQIIDFLPDATFAIDLSGKVIVWNRASEEMTGVKAEQMLGKGDHEYTLPFYGIRRPILIDLVFISDEEIENKYHFIRKDGDVLLAEADVPVTGGAFAPYGEKPDLYMTVRAIL